MYASFAGSASYYASSAVSSFAVDPAVEVPAQPEPAADMTGSYVAYATVAIIAAIALVDAVIVPLLRKRP